MHKQITVAVMVATLALAGCANMNETQKGTAKGAGIGAAGGAVLGAVAGKGKGAAIGAAVGAGIGAVSSSNSGRNLNLFVIVVGIIRLMLGGGII